MEHIRIIQTPVGALLEELKGRIAFFEEVYGMSSSEMRARLLANEFIDTPEMARWMQSYYVLQKLQR